MVCQLFGLSVEADPDLRVFPPFEHGADPLDNSASQSALQHLLAELNMRLKTTDVISPIRAKRKRSLPLQLCSSCEAERHAAKALSDIPCIRKSIESNRVTQFRCSKPNP